MSPVDCRKVTQALADTPISSLQTAAVMQPEGESRHQNLSIEENSAHAWRRVLPSISLCLSECATDCLLRQSDPQDPRFWGEV
jgi:hypothetical protein